MEKALIDFIQNPKNIELLNLGQIDTLLQKCPVNLRPQLIKMLADSDIDLKDTGNKMYGIQTAQTKNIFKDTYKLTVKSPNHKSNPLAYGISLVKSNGVQSGSLVAFKSLKNAYNFIKLLGEDGILSPFKMSHSNNYNWVEVPYKENPNVKFWITDNIRDYYDLDKRKYQKQLQNAYQKLNQEFQNMLTDKYFSADDLQNYLRAEFDNDNYKYIYLGVYLNTVYKGYRINISTYSHDDLQDVFKSVEPKVNNFLKQYKINSNDLILKIVNNSIRLELNNTQLLNDLANQLNDEFGVNLQQGYPEIFN